MPMAAPMLFHQPPIGKSFGTDRIDNAVSAFAAPPLRQGQPNPQRRWAAVDTSRLPNTAIMGNRRSVHAILLMRMSSLPKRTVGLKIECAIPLSCSVFSNRAFPSKYSSPQCSFGFVMLTCMIRLTPALLAALEQAPRVFNGPRHV